MAASVWRVQAGALAGWCHACCDGRVCCAQVGTLAYIVSFALGAGPVPGLLVPEITPLRLRGAAPLPSLIRARLSWSILQPRNLMVRFRTIQVKTLVIYA